MKTAANALARSVAQVLVAAAFLAPAGVAFPASGQGTNMAVSATILKRASVKFLSQPQSLVITSTDIARGYVDVRNASRIAVQCNSRGYMLMFENRSDFVSSTRVRGLGGEIQLGASSVVVPRATDGTGVNSMTHELEFRFMLSPSAQEGTHPWPMEVSAVPM